MIWKRLYDNINTIAVSGARGTKMMGSRKMLFIKFTTVKGAYQSEHRCTEDEGYIDILQPIVCWYTEGAVVPRIQRWTCSWLRRIGYARPSDITGYQWTGTKSCRIILVSIMIENKGWWRRRLWSDEKVESSRTSYEREYIISFALIPEAVEWGGRYGAWARTYQCENHHGWTRQWHGLLTSCYTLVGSSNKSWFFCTEFANPKCRVWVSSATVICAQSSWCSPYQRRQNHNLFRNIYA